MTRRQAIVIALLGAESTGKTTLAQALRDALVAEGRDAVVVAEYLREFCDRAGRTPNRTEQHEIAAEQTRRIEAAATDHEIVIADTTALMTAIYSQLVFADAGLDAAADAAHRRCDATLVTALDLPWQADGLQRDGAHVRAPVDAAVRAALQRGAISYSVVVGSGPARVAAARAAVRRVLEPARGVAGAARWQWVCEHCGDPACERRLLARRD